MSFEQVTLRTANGQEFGPVAMDVLLQWHREGRVPKDGMLVDAVTGETRPVADFPALLVPPPPVAGVPQAAAPITGADHLIPVKNPKALIAYYLGIFGIIVWILGPPAFILGIMGKRDAKTLGVGKTHAWFGIILGALESLLCLLAIVAIVVGVVFGRRG